MADQNGRGLNERKKKSKVSFKVDEAFIMHSILPFKFYFVREKRDKKGH